MVSNKQKNFIQFNHVENQIERKPGLFQDASFLQMTFEILNKRPEACCVFLDHVLLFHLQMMTQPVNVDQMRTLRIKSIEIKLHSG